MKLAFTHIASSPRLLLIFAGWGVDSAMFEDIRCADRSVAVVYDYRALEPLQLSEQYVDIAIVAWSFGVHAATWFMLSNPQLPITMSIAVAGTLTPVNDLTGIPHSIFNGTLSGLSERSLSKFYRRMCGSREAFAKFSETLPKRDINELAVELQAIAPRSFPLTHNSLWHSAVICNTDAIIPADAQRKAWKGHRDVEEIDAPHLPPFQEIITRYIVDKNMIASRFSRHASTYQPNAPVQAEMAETLTNLALPLLSTPTPNILEIGAGSGLLTRQYLKHIAPSTLTLCDIAAIDRTLPGEHLIADGEQLVCQLPQQSFDLIISGATVQWFTSPFTFIDQSLKLLRKGGVLAISTFNSNNFAELAPFATPRRYISLEQWHEALKRSNAIIKCSERTIRFATPMHLLKHMQLSGVNAHSASASQAFIAAKNILKSGLSQLTYCPLYIIISKS